MFNLKAMLMWTINDFPAYGNLSGYSTKGKVACPVCHAETCSKYLNHSKKLVYMGHRRFLAPDHRYWKKASWFDGNEENRRKPKIVTHEEVFLEVKDFINDRGENGNKRKKRNTIQMWKKKSIFFLFAILEDTLCKINGFFGYSSLFIFVVKFIIANDDYYNSCK